MQGTTVWQFRVGRLTTKHISACKTRFSIGLPHLVAAHILYFPEELRSDSANEMRSDTTPLCLVTGIVQARLLAPTSQHRSHAWS